jgi:hypothetical protein
MPGRLRMMAYELPWLSEYRTMRSGTVLERPCVDQNSKNNSRKLVSCEFGRTKEIGC